MTQDKKASWTEGIAEIYGNFWHNDREDCLPKSETNVHKKNKANKKAKNPFMIEEPKPDSQDGIETLILKKLEMDGLGELDKVTNEAKQLRKLQHRNIVAYHDEFLHEDSRTLSENKYKFLLIMEYCRNGDLLSKINKWHEAK